MSIIPRDEAGDKIGEAMIEPVMKKTNFGRQSATEISAKAHFLQPRSAERVSEALISMAGGNPRPSHFQSPFLDLLLRSNVKFMNSVRPMTLIAQQRNCEMIMNSGSLVICRKSLPILQAC